MSLAGESCLDMNALHFKILRRRPMIRTQRKPSKRNVLLNAMPVSTDPGLSPSTSHLMSPTSHRSSWSSASEFEQSPSSKSSRQGGKINQLIKVNEAITVELADLESGKERWLEKLKLLEARICSNLVNIDKWAAENKSKLVSIEAMNDHGYVGDITKVGETPFSGSPSTWQLSLADLVSIFKGAKSEHANRFSQERRKDGPVFPSTDENLFYSGCEGSPPSSNKVSLQGDTPVSSEKGSPLSKRANRPADTAVKEGRNLPEHPSEAYKTFLGEGRKFSPVGINSVAAVGSSSWNEEDSILIEANHAVENASRPGNTLFTKALSPSKISPSRGAVYPSQKKERPHSRGRLALHRKDVPTNAEEGPAARLGPEATEKGIGDSFDDEVLSRNQGTDESNGSSNSISQATFMQESEDQFHPASNQMRLHDALEEARQDVQRFKHQSGLGQVEPHDVLGQARQELEQLKQHAFALEKEKGNLESNLADCKQALERANLDSATLQMQKEELQTMLNNLKASSDSERLALLKEKDDQGKKLLSSGKSLEEAQQSAIVLERQKLVLQSELNFSKDVLEKTQKDLKGSTKEKAALQLEFAGCKQTLQEAQRFAVLLEKERDDIAVLLNECKTNLEKNGQHCLMLEKEKDELQRDLAESKHTIEEGLQKSSMVEREKRDLEAAHESLLSDLEKSKQNALVLENKNTLLENMVTEFKHRLEEIQQQVMVLEGEKDDLQSELQESKHASKEAWQHAISLEEEKSALEIGFCECKGGLEETEQHVLTLKRALDGTLQRADALDHQVQRLRDEKKRWFEINESLKALDLEQETKCRDLEMQREALEAEMESIKSKKEAAEETVIEMNALHASAMEEIKKETEALQQQNSLLKKQSDSLKVMLEGATQRSLRLEADQKEMQERLKDGEHSLEKAAQDLDKLRAEHGNVVAALKSEKAANEGKIQKLMEQLQAKCIELERLCKVEMEVEHVNKKLKDRESQLELNMRELESTKAEMGTEGIYLDREKAAREALLQEVNAKDNKVMELEKNLIMIRAEQTGLREAMRDELAKKKVLQLKLQGEEACRKDLEVALELARLEQNNLLMDLENERMVKEAALEEMEALRSYSEELEKDFGNLQAEMHVMCEEENEEQTASLQALDEEQTRSRELVEAVQLTSAEQEDAQLAWEDERDVNEVLMQELEQEQKQRIQLEEQLKVLRAEEEQVGAFLQEERASMERLKKRLEAQEARCRKLEDALNCARIEQDSMQMALDEEATLKRAVMQELEDERKRCLELEQVKARKDETGVDADAKRETLNTEVTELLAKSKQLEQLLSLIQRVGADDEAHSAVTQEVKELQSRIQDIELKLADAGYVVHEGKEKSEDELLALLQDSPSFELGAASSEAPDGKQRNSSMDVARQTEEELRKLKESTELFHHALFDAHHTAIADVASLLAELQSLKQLLDDKTMVASEKKGEKRKGSMSLPTAALSTSALAAIGLLAFLKLPKHSNT